MQLQRPCSRALLRLRPSVALESRLSVIMSAGCLLCMELVMLTFTLNYESILHVGCRPLCSLSYSRIRPFLSVASCYRKRSADRRVCVHHSCALICLCILIIEHFAFAVVQLHVRAACPCVLALARSFQSSTMLAHLPYSYPCYHCAVLPAPQLCTLLAAGLLP